MNLKAYVLPPLKLIFSQATLNIVVYQMLIVTNVPVNSAALYQFMQCVTLLLILEDTGLKHRRTGRRGGNSDFLCSTRNLGKASF